MNQEYFLVLIEYLGPFMTTASVIGGIVGFAIGMHVGNKVKEIEEKES